MVEVDTLSLLEEVAQASSVCWLEPTSHLLLGRIITARSEVRTSTTYNNEAH